MAIVCEKDFTLHISSQVSLVDYWDFDEAFSPFLAKLDPDNNFQLDSGPGSLVGGGVGILNTCMVISGISAGSTAGVRTASFTNPLIVPHNGFTWTTWINHASLGTGASNSTIFEIHFYPDVGGEVVNFSAVIGPGPVSTFMTVQRNHATFFSPTIPFGEGIWSFIHIQYDSTSRKFGLQRGHPVFGLSGIQESAAIVDDFSTITKGYLLLEGERGLFGPPVSPDYRQDESGFWARLLTNSEVIQLFGGGTPPSYPNIPQ